uniref:Synaptosomal-associated protein 23 n=1 Tax=Anolis carolinensis TaxID=28377 RepID=G1KJC7_ANOCA
LDNRLLSSEEIQLKIHQLKDESLECSERICLLASECQDAGIKIISMLDEQGEQLNRIEGSMDHIEKDVKEAEKSLMELSKCCGLNVCPSKNRKKAGRKPCKTILDDEEDLNHNVVFEQPRYVTHLKKKELLEARSRGCKAQKANDARDCKTEENLTQVGNILGNLKNMALEMGNVLHKQNKQVNWINKKADINTSLIEQANAKAKNCIDY